MSSRKERLENLNRILTVCRKEGWNYETPNVAGKIYALFKNSGYTERTVQDYVRAVVDMLESEMRLSINS